MKNYLSLIFLMAPVFSHASIKIRNLENKNLEEINPTQVEAVKLSFNIFKGKPEKTECNKTGKRGLDILNKYGFSSPEKLPGIPACVIAGSIEIVLKNKKASRKFDILCSEFARDPKTDDYFKFSKAFKADVCEPGSQTTLRTHF